MGKEEDKIELRSEEFQDVLGYVPPWILRWGITVLGIILLILLIGSAIFKYPDVISSSIVLTGSTPPAAIVAQSTGKISELFVTDNQSVKSGEYLAVIDNPAKTEDVLWLMQYLGKLDLESDTLLTLPPKNLMLGSVQSLFSTFYISMYEYREYKRLQYYSSKIGILSERITQYEKQYANTSRQQVIVKEQLLITGKQFQRDSILNAKGLISHEVFENMKIQYLQALLSHENICSSLDNMQIQIAQSKESLFEMQFQYIDKENTFKSQLRTLLAQLQNEIQFWEKTYALKAPISGEITFTNYWAKNQNIAMGNIAFTIIPAEEIRLVGKASLPVTRSGKVKVGQKVNIHFANFPDHEFGVVRGEVKNISLVPVKENESMGYAVEIALPKGLETSYRKVLPYLPGMQGSADIITDDITLLERFIMPLRKALTEGIQ